MEEINIGVINLQLENNKKAIEDLKTELKDINRAYDAFNDKVMSKLIELDTKVKYWGVGGAVVVSLLSSIISKKFGV